MKVIVGISGGVDSSVSCILLQQKGYEVIGVTFKTLDNFDCSDAINVANMLNIEHHVIDITKEFKNDIVDNFLDSYKNGLTPNPCVLCNKKIKFKYLYDAMIKYNCDYMATGHYAKIEDGKLYKSTDLNKDQTYFLANVSKEMLSKTLFPLEGITKEEVRKIALEYNLINANKKDSYDVCFIDDKFKNYMASNLNTACGDVIDIDTNKVIGKHSGLVYYTIGQRRGLNIGGMSDRMFVVGKNTKENILYVSLGDNNDYLYSDSCIIKNVNFINDYNIKKCMAKFRYRSLECPVTLEYLDNNEILVRYSAMKSVTPGQTCVFYIDDECVGGGEIKTVFKNDKKVWYIL